MSIDMDTIAAIATPIGKGGIGIIRVSGALAKNILGQVFRPKSLCRKMEPRYLVLGDIVDPKIIAKSQDTSTEEQASGETSMPGSESEGVLDQALAVLMPGPHSYTGEDVVELQCHGGPKLMQEVLALVLGQGARLATPGEFTLRAFLNGRLDLAQAEAVCDLIEAKTPQAAVLAERQLAGVLSHQLAEIEKGLLHILALITVGVDFPDDVDAPESTEVLALLNHELERIKEMLAGADLGLSYREGIRTALLGAVNAGKSSLLNALLKRERAIVTNQPGTTRDLIEEYLDIDGIPLCICDTAGLRTGEIGDEVERLGIKRSHIAAEQARLILLIIDASKKPTKQNQELIHKTADKKQIIVFNKSDIATKEEIAAHLNQLGSDISHCSISAKTGEGLDKLKAMIKEICGASLDSEADSPLINNLRHREALREAKEHLSSAIATLNQDIPIDLAGIDIENACRALGQITGTTVSDEVLEEIFSRFCLGK